MRIEIKLLVFCWHFVGGASSGIMLLYRPRDISNDCFSSQNLNYYLTFGMGMSDTITLVFRTQHYTDYDCTIDVVTEPGIFLLMVIMYPNEIQINCRENRHAFTLIEGENCVAICDLMDNFEMKYNYFKNMVPEKIRFQFKGNSSINSNMNTNLYQITFTAARMTESPNCMARNECICTMRHFNFCFTSGVVCDGVKNCGVEDWYDERKTDCQLPTQKMNFHAMVAVAAVLFLALLGGAHLMFRCLPPLANSFFIFNANEDNRLYIDAVLQPPEKDSTFQSMEKRRRSVIPVYLSSSEEASVESGQDSTIADELVSLNLAGNTQVHVEPEGDQDTRSATTTTRMKSMTARLQDRLRAVAGLARHQAQDADPHHEDI